eukprot:CAMPEP_0178956694 /NCGR_PEP_ID=MMETSP0789-20121207/10435_1 /TAXON_ID=3005 /ORGANISM="Rhizosolenia setigera, Strain CCMP 1694" /LENGTH=473 /DNA_ID=CAMNT_0020638729 /DNA_START=283 /DNA_END=1704 /DNA_ORIENTATION=+
MDSTCRTTSSLSMVASRESRRKLQQGTSSKKYKITNFDSSSTDPTTLDESSYVVSPITGRQRRNVYIQKDTIEYLLSDEDDDNYGRGHDDYSTDAANEVADKKQFSRMSDEAKLKATMAITRKQSRGGTTTIRASVKETGNDAIGSYLKSMGSHELLRKEDEIVLGRQIQILVKWEAVRQELEVTLERTPTFAEWASELQTTVPELKKQIRRSQRAKAALIEANLRLVVTLARQSMKGGSEISFQDACQEGILGLAKACEKFDPEKGFRFSTYANWWIKRNVNENVAEQSRGSIKMPYNVVRKINQIKITEVTLKDELGRKPTDKELAEALEITVEKLQFYRQKSQTAMSLDKNLTGKTGKGSSASGANAGSSDGGFTINDTVRDPGLCPTEAASKQMLKDDVRRLIKTLSPREQVVIRLRFGLDDGKPKKLDFIANKFNTTKEKIRKVEARALLKLKQPYRSKSVECYIPDL